MAGLRRFLVFSGDDYSPLGGWKDFQGSYDTLVEAKDSLLSTIRPAGRDWHLIVDTESCQVVSEN